MGDSRSPVRLTTVESPVWLMYSYTTKESLWKVSGRLPYRRVLPQRLSASYVTQERDWVCEDLGKALKPHSEPMRDLCRPSKVLWLRMAMVMSYLEEIVTWQHWKQRWVGVGGWGMDMTGLWSDWGGYKIEDTHHTTGSRMPKAGDFWLNVGCQSWGPRGKIAQVQPVQLRHLYFDQDLPICIPQFYLRGSHV